MLRVHELAVVPLIDKVRAANDSEPDSGILPAEGVAVQHCRPHSFDTASLRGCDWDEASVTPAAEDKVHEFGPRNALLLA